MAVDSKNLTWALAATEDVDDLTSGTGALYKAIDASGTIASNGSEAIGILKFVGKNTEHIRVDVIGISKFVAAAAIGVGADITVTTSGYFTNPASGDVVIGKNLDVAVASGAVGTALFDFAQSGQVDVSSAHKATFETFDFTTTEDLTGAEGKAINADSGGLIFDANDADGVLVTGTTSGTTSTARGMGLSTILSTGSDTIGVHQSITVTDSGMLRTANSGDLISGKSITAINCLTTGIAMVNFATPHFATNCFDVQY